MGYGRYLLCLHAFVAALLLNGCGVEKVQPASKGADTRTPSGAEAPGASKTMVTKTGIEMVSIPAGEFTMGDDRGEDDERPARSVKIGAFHMDAFEVTQESYEKLMGTNPAKHKNPKNPVEQLGWFGAIKYCNMRSNRDGLKPCYNLNTLECDFGADGYRLPTEAEWEYACRARTKTDYSFAGGTENLDGAGWFEKNAGGSTHPVGQKKPNPWGLYDMHGNVAEWCNDVYDGAYYGTGANADPCNTGPGDERTLRGGAWNSAAEWCRCSARYSEAPGLADVCFGYDAYGFRCVRRVSADPPRP